MLNRTLIAMTRRETYLKAIRNEPVDVLVWAPNIDYWLQTNQAEGTLPRKYAGMSRNDIVRAIGGYIWNRATGLKRVLDSSVVENVWKRDESLVHEYHTPLGDVTAVYQASDGEHRSKFLAEHFIKDLDSLNVMKYVVDATHYEPEYEPTLQALKETGDDGIVVNSCFCVPFIQFAQIDAGYVNGYYMWMDHKEEVDSLLDAYMKAYLQGYAVLADGPADVIASDDNMDGAMISPRMFEEYVLPFYKAAGGIFSTKGKAFEGHWCGRTQNLLAYAPGSGLNVVEAILSKPMAEIELESALNLLQGEVVLQGGIPSVLVCDEGGSKSDFEAYIERVIRPLRGRRGFVLGMSDNVPPNADFSRVESVAELINWP